MKFKESQITKPGIGLSVVLFLAGASTFACDKDKDATASHHHHHKKFFKAVHACASEKGVALPEFKPGEAKPSLTDAQKNVLKECRTEVAASFKAKRATASTE